MSFYFNHNTLVSPDTKKKINRFERLFIPYIGLLQDFIKNIINYALSEY